jgi:hypothetical protein
MTLGNLSPLNRALRFLTAFVTVWCLGCSSFEPLLGSLLGAKGVGNMACGSDDAMREPAGREAVAANFVNSAGSAIAAPDAGQQPNFDCGCQFCAAVSLPALLVATPRPFVPSVPTFEPATLAGIEREPLVPPPQRTLQRA